MSDSLVRGFGHRVGHDLLLRGVRVRAAVEGLLMHVEVVHDFVHTGNVLIEPVYTFPMPPASTLLDVELTLNGETHRAMALRRGSAASAYELAIKEGETAVQVSVRLGEVITCSVGALRPGDECQITLRYGVLLQVFEGHVHIALPTVIGERYGDPGAAGFQPEEAPRHNLFARYHLDCELRLCDLGSAARVSCVTHHAHIAPDAFGGDVLVTLPPDAELDRDVVVVVEAATIPPVVFTASGLDHDETILLGQLVAPATDADDAADALRLLLVIDCSGSMDSRDRIGNARAIASELIAKLDPNDAVGVLRFGTAHEVVRGVVAPLSGAERKDLLDTLAVMRADCGGTEVAAAIRACGTDIETHGQACPLVLITDGEVHDIRASVQAAEELKHRVSVVMVGRRRTPRSAPTSPGPAMAASKSSIDLKRSPPASLDCGPGYAKRSCGSARSTLATQSSSGRYRRRAPSPPASRCRSPRR